MLSRLLLCAPGCRLSLHRRLCTVKPSLVLFSTRLLSRLMFPNIFLTISKATNWGDFCSTAASTRRQFQCAILNNNLNCVEADCDDKDFIRVPVMQRENSCCSWTLSSWNYITSLKQFTYWETWMYMYLYVLLETVSLCIFPILDLFLFFQCFMSCYVVFMFQSILQEARTQFSFQQNQNLSAVRTTSQLRISNVRKCTH